MAYGIFGLKSTYRIGNFKWCEIDYLINAIENLKVKDNDIKVFGNEINARTILDSDGYLYTSAPYSKGLTAFVNGEKQDILKANDAFMAVSLPAGKYDVQFKYCTPYLIPGVITARLSLCILFGMYLRDKRQKE